MAANRTAPEGAPSQGGQCRAASRDADRNHGTTLARRFNGELMALASHALRTVRVLANFLSSDDRDQLASEVLAVHDELDHRCYQPPSRFDLAVEQILAYADRVAGGDQ